MLAHIEVSGRVQGVGFRDWTVRTARKLNISGWVRNRTRGTVEILADGDDLDVKAFLVACQKGPLWARVQSIQTVSIPDATVFPVETGLFRQLPTV